MRVHARFSLVEDRRISFYHESGNKDAMRVQLAAVKGEPFGPATPQGTIDMLIVNPEAVQMFRDAAIGQEFDVLFSPVSKEE